MRAMLTLQDDDNDFFGEAYYNNDGKLDCIYAWNVPGIRFMEIHFDDDWEYDYYNYEPVVSDIYGVSVTAGFRLFENARISNYDKNYYAAFNIDGIYYMLEVYGNDDISSDKNFEIIVNNFIKNINTDLSLFDNPEIPEMSFEWIESEEKARLDFDFGKYIPENIPAGFSFSSAYREINQNFDGLDITWVSNVNPENIINFQVGKYKDYDYTDASSENVFLAKELNADGIKNYSVNRSVSSAYFFVLYDDFLVFINPSSSMTNEQIWNMIPVID
jgi:hypothetical protein